MGMTRFAILVSAALFFLAAVPLQASGSNAVTEPSDLALFALGLIGVIVGRKGVMRNKQRDRDGDR